MANYVCSDFHGFKSLYDQIHNFIKPEDHVYFLGDAADRGPHGWECIKAILDDPQWTYLMGNHDFFFVREILGPDMRDHSMEHYQNGGRPTLDAYWADTEDNQKKYIHLLRDVPYDAIYINERNEVCYMSHSGAYKNTTGWFDSEEFVWDRSHFLAKMPEGVDYIFHGHTTIPHLCDQLERYNHFYDDVHFDVPEKIEPGTVFWYGNKCDVDNCTIATGACVLLDLDTFEQHSFFVSDEEKEYLW